MNDWRPSPGTLVWRTYRGLANGIFLAGVGLLPLGLAVALAQAVLHELSRGSFEPLLTIFMLGALAAGVFLVWLGLGPGGPAQSQIELDLAQRRVRYGVVGKQEILSLDAIELVAVQPVRNDITVHVRGGSTYQKVEHEEQVVVFPGGRALWTAGMPSRAVHAIAGHLAQAIGRPVVRLGGDVSAPLPGPWTHGARVAVRLPGNVPAVGFLSQATPTGAVDPRRAPNLVVLLTTGQTVRVGMSDVAPIG